MAEKQKTSVAQQLDSWLAQLTPKQKSILRAGLNVIDANQNGAFSFDELAKAESKFAAQKSKDEKVSKIHNQLTKEMLHTTSTQLFDCNNNEPFKNYDKVALQIANEMGGKEKLDEVIRRKGPDYEKFINEQRKRVEPLERESRKKCDELMETRRAALKAAREKLPELQVGSTRDAFYSIVGSIVKGEQLVERPNRIANTPDFIAATWTLSPSLVQNVVGLAQEKTMDQIVKEAGAFLNMPMAGKLAENDLAPAIKELNAVLQGHGLPIIADGFVQDAVDAARKRPKKPDSDAAKKPSR
jgi:hypothetical protein